MQQTMALVVRFEDLGREDIAVAGGKGANLGEMTRARIPVPPGFVVTAGAYYDFLDRTNLRATIRELLDGLDRSDSAALARASEAVKEAILAAPMPEATARAIRQAYHDLGGGAVAVRSSATAEDLPEASFAGQQSTFLNIEGDDQVVEAVQKCWASLFEGRAIFYRTVQGFDHLQVGIAVPVQRMVQSESSGVMFTLEPVSSDASKIVVEAVYGLGEAIVSGAVTPDLYVVDKQANVILERKVVRQEWQLVRDPNAGLQAAEANIKAEVAAALRDKPKLTDEEVLSLAEIGRQVEALYGFPQDIEWAKSDGAFYIVQTRPVTTVSAGEEAQAVVSDAALLLSGSAASPGADSGPAKVIRSAAEIDVVREGDVLVTGMTTPDFVPAMKRAVAIVTDQGGRTCHAAIVSRELGIPCVVGTSNATTVLTTGQIVTVDGTQGKVYAGRVSTSIVSRKKRQPRYAHVKTKTRVYVNLAEPELADVVAPQNVDGVGLLRAEFIIAQIGEHPKHMISQKRGHEFVDRLADGLQRFAKAFNPRPVVYRATDFKTNEYRNLIGGEAYEEQEENPMLGYRGCFRYLDDVEVFDLEIEAIKKVRRKYKNLWLMIPFVHTVDEMARVKRLLAKRGLRRSKTFKLWMMVEVPSNIFLLDEFLDLGIDGISIGSNDLTQLILGLDRDSPKVAPVFDERNPAVMKALEIAVTTASRRGVTSSICGQAPSVYPELTRKLVQWGITSVSVSPDMIDETRGIIYNIERRRGRASS